MVRKWPILKWPILARLHQNDRCCSKMTDTWAKMTDAWAKMTNYLLKWPIPNSQTWKILNRSFWLVRKWPIIATKMTDFKDKNDRFLLGCTKMTDCSLKWPILKMYEWRKWPIIGLKWPILKSSTHLTRLKWPIVGAKMTDFRGQNDRF